MGEGQDAVMQCLVTAGPTYEPIDQVRRMTNFSTGRLGTELALVLAERGHEVMLLRGEMATFPAPARERLGIESFTTTQDLGARLEKRCGTPPDAVFHAAAVSDFAVGGLFFRRDDGSLEPARGAKVSSRASGLLMELVPTVKLLGRFREWFPNAFLVGWKYEVDGGREGALAAGRRQLEYCLLDATVVNGPAFGSGFGILTGPEALEELDTREALFEGLLRRMGRGQT